jgi:hypothetical protein
MNVRFRRFGLASIVAVSACAPFGPIPTDGGDGGSDSTIDSRNDVASADVPQELAPEPADASDAIADLPADTSLDVAGPDAAGKPNGTSCGGGGECASGDCVEGTCCATACGSRCFSCLNSKTGQPDGKCAPVQAGIAHAADCVAGDPTTCGLDGKCDGAGACRYWPSTTSCGAESCVDGAGASMYTSARTCAGAGTCAAATTSTCGNAYRCSSTKCKTTCSSASDCIAAAYCVGNACVAKKPDGQVCSSNAECINGVCGGVCCAAGCMCTQPSPSNVVTNPGIDHDTTGWTVTGGTLTRSLSDAQKCPYSGSLDVICDPTAQECTLSQCVSNAPLVGAFNFGVKVRGVSPALCQIDFYSGFNCDADPILDNETNPTTGDGLNWESTTLESDMSNIPLSGVNSVQIRCYPSGTETDFDMFFVSKVPGTF